MTFSFFIFVLVGAGLAGLVRKMPGFLWVFMDLRKTDVVAFGVLAGGSCSENGFYSLIMSTNDPLSCRTTRTDTMGTRPVCFNSDWRVYQSDLIPHRLYCVSSDCSLLCLYCELYKTIHYLSEALKLLVI